MVNPKNSKKLADWNKDKLYDEWLLEYVKKEPGIKALERSIIYLQEWETDNEANWTEYFKLAAKFEQYMISRSAKISHGYCISETGDLLIVRFSDEQTAND